MCKDAPNSLLLDVLLGAQTALNDLLEVATLTILHHDVEFEVFLINAAIIVSHDVLVLEIAQDIDL